MNPSNFTHSAKRTLANIPGWRTWRKIIVFESDDWGSIRMPSKEIYKKCLKAGYPVDQTAYEKYDSLLSEDDLEVLFETLSCFKDRNGNHPIITANCLVANPDFKRIRNDNYQKYHYELITDTFKNYPKHSRNFELWKQGMKEGVFFLQYHGREHLNVSLFMDSLRKGDPDTIFACDNNMPGIIPKRPKKIRNDYVEATKYNSYQDKEEKLSIILEGLDLFQKMFGYRTISITPPNYIWSLDYNPFVFSKGVILFQGNRKIIEPVPNGKPIYHSVKLGKQNELGQIYLIRNSMFEPSEYKSLNEDPVDRCLSEIASAFRVNKPAIISCHRINFVGFIDTNNRDSNIKLLNMLIKKTLSRWPEAEFMTSVQLGQIILNDLNKR